ncbi:MAG: tRNA lysidine(34) synthetase TilS [Thermoguttaceae bacterium]|nr:tRNA lysidine(34) synthetase TilS [Thermoguttaceae bacterium]
MTSSSDFEKQVLDSFPSSRWAKRRVLLAVSGGADSVALLRAFVAVASKEGLLRRLSVATVDHRARGAESDADVQFVQELAERFQLPIDVLTLDPQAVHEEARDQGSWESAARTLRYRALYDAAKKRGARFIATAHHRDDQLETLLFRLFRGSGLAGLRGVAPYRVVDESLVVVRPLLRLGRDDILDYLKALDQPFRVDSSNASPKYARNRVRNELVPLLDDLFPNKWRGALLRLSQIADETESNLEARVEKLEERVREAKEKEKTRQIFLDSIDARDDFREFDLPLDPLRNVPTEILIRYFRKHWEKNGWPLGEMGAEEWRRLVDAVREKIPPNQFPGGVSLSFPNDAFLRLEILPRER